MHLVGFTIEIYHDARSHEHQIYRTTYLDAARLLHLKQEKKIPDLRTLTCEQRTVFGAEI